MKTTSSQQQTSPTEETVAKTEETVAEKVERLRHLSSDEISHEDFNLLLDYYAAQNSKPAPTAKRSPETYKPLKGEINYAPKRTSHHPKRGSASNKHPGADESPLEPAPEPAFAVANQFADDSAPGSYQKMAELASTLHQAEATEVFSFGPKIVRAIIFSESAEACDLVLGAYKARVPDAYGQLVQLPEPRQKTTVYELDNQRAEIEAKKLSKKQNHEIGPWVAEALATFNTAPNTYAQSIGLTAHFLAPAPKRPAATVDATPAAPTLGSRNI